MSVAIRCRVADVSGGRAGSQPNERPNGRWVGRPVEGFTPLLFGPQDPLTRWWEPGVLDTAVPARPVPRPTAPPTERGRALDHAFVLGFAGAVGLVVTIGLWLRHGGVAAATGPGGPLTAVGQITALVGTYAVLVQLLLMSRIAWIERAIGLDRLAVWHRWTGFATVWLLGAHVVFTTAGYAQGDKLSLWGQTRNFLSHYPDVLMAWVGFALFIAIAVTSVRAAAQARPTDVVLRAPVRLPCHRAHVRPSARGRD